MRTIKITLYIIFYLLTNFPVLSQEKNLIGKSYAPFSMDVVNGGSIDSSDWNNFKGIAFVFVCNHCPMAKLYWGRIQEMYEQGLKTNVLVVAVNPMDSLIYKEESRALMVQKVQMEKVSLPYVQDADQSIGKRFNIPHTPACVLLWKESSTWKVAYEGSFDDNGAKPNLAIPYLQNAVDALLKGTIPAVQTTESFGCRVFYRGE